MHINVIHYFWAVMLAGLLLTGCSTPKERAEKNLATANAAYLKQATDFIRAVAPKDDYILNDRPDSGAGFNCLDGLKEDSLLTKAELDYVIQQSTQPPIKKWTTDLIPNTKLISADTISQIFNDRKKGWDYFYKKIGRSVSSYSAPIFLRNNTYCLFYNSNGCGWLCGTGRLSLYKKEGKQWKIVKTYCNWIS
ncbi:hypothetical protein VRU48_11075 [Pedobacter sp. KR3-3]|uniref:DUF4440 domain-containing protein n=1 Tax=Pedobacter albus TaxID=3113905 RepID=A0ABU7I8D6_9SPHI|nr:hypothetical protein [Pedobacter sp. KR3-3]MEE1945649.1 hypothetical protein [Pedobacter sp. KR3-3]